MESVPSYAGSWRDLPVQLSAFTHTHFSQHHTRRYEALESFGFTNMTPVQAAVIPLFLKNKDVVVEAVTGSGKTLAFLIPILELLSTRTLNHPQALIISPTRELAYQIYSVFQLFKPFLPTAFNAQLIVGGAMQTVKQGDTQVNTDIRKFNETRPALLIGTPGRLEQVLSEFPQDVRTKELDIVVLDEADRLLDMGFAPQLGKIFTLLPKQRRTTLFSATMSDALNDLVKAGLRDPVRVTVRVEDVQHKQVEEWRTPSSLEISYLVTRPATKLLMLCRMLEREPDNKYIVYMATCACVNYFNKVLSGLERLSKFKIVALHGQLDSKKRSIAFNTFSRVPEGTPAILLCTDVAARGLDLPFVDRVVQYDPPQDPRAFSHRCGRTARAGRKGKAVVFVSRGPEEVYAEFMRVRKIPMVRHDYINHQRQLVPIDDVDDDSSIQMEQDDHEHVQDLMQEIRQMAIADRDIYEKGTRAFVSYVQSYAKHEAAYIFRIRELDLGAIATSFGLLRLPKMPELNRSSHLVQFSSWEGNPDALTYADAPREKQRQERLKQLEIKRQEAIEAGEPLFKNTHKSSQPWSKVREARAKRKENREKRHKKAEYRQQQKMDTQREALGLEKAKRKQVDVSDFEQEWEELQREERLAKQLKKGKIDKKTYAKLVGEDEEGELL